MRGFRATEQCVASKMEARVYCLGAAGRAHDEGASKSSMAGEWQEMTMATVARGGLCVTNIRHCVKSWGIDGRACKWLRRSDGLPRCTIQGQHIRLIRGMKKLCAKTTERPHSARRWSWFDSHTEDDLERRFGVAHLDMPVG